MHMAHLELVSVVQSQNFEPLLNIGNALAFVLISQQTFEQISETLNA